MDREALKKSLIRHEGVRLQAYKDTEGYWTIGVGHKLPARTNRVMTIQEVMDQLEVDMDEAIEDAERFSWYYNLNGKRQAVIVEMVFQLGFSGVSKFIGMINAIVAEDYERAAYEMEDSKWHKQTKARCEELAEIMRNG
jgi:lysozyme